jgi:LacI family transcriptional regulator
LTRFGAEATRSRSTMREVAALAGVSVKTVSRVINGERGVSEVLTAQVRAAIDRLDYRPNLTASTLRRSDGRTAAIGLLLEDVANPFSSTLHREIENFALSRGVLVFAGSSDEDQARERELIAEFISRRVDGLIIVPASHDHSYLQNEHRAGTATVFVDRPPQFLDADSVVTDNEAGSRAGVRHLIARGHRRIAYLGDLQIIATAASRHRGYVDEMSAHKLDIDPQLVRLNVRGTESAESAVTDLVSSSPPPTAIFTSQNLLTIGAYRALRKLTLHRTIALVGFDDFELADMLEPGITVMAQDPAAMGRAAAEILFRRIDGDRSGSIHTVIPTRLIARGSGEIMP